MGVFLEGPKKTKKKISFLTLFLFLPSSQYVAITILVKSVFITGDQDGRGVRHGPSPTNTSKKKNLHVE